MSKRRPATLCECMHAYSEHMESWEENTRQEFKGCTAFGQCRCEAFVYGGPLKPYEAPREKRTFVPPICACQHPRWRHEAKPNGGYGACAGCSETCAEYDPWRVPPSSPEPTGPRGPRSKRMKAQRERLRLTLRGRAA